MILIICAACGNIQVLEAGANPVKKALLVVTGCKSQVRIDPLFDDSDNDEQGHDDHDQAGVVLCSNPNNRNRNQANKIWASHPQNQASQQREVAQLRTEGQTNTRRFVERTFLTDVNVRRIALQPGQQPHGANNPAGANSNFAAAISPTPRMLHEL
jgi:hypothetical protein